MNKRKVYLDILRIMAIFLVIFNHLEGYTLYQESGGIRCWICMFITMFTRINVPLFFMVSGALLLNKTEDFITVLRKRVIRYVIIIFGFNAAYVIIKSLVLTDYSITLADFIAGCFKGDIPDLGSYWFLYAYLGLLFMLPFLQRMAKGLNKQDFAVLIILHFILSSFIPLLNIILVKCNVTGLEISREFSVPLATIKAFFYPLIGYYLENKVEIKEFSKKAILGIGGVAIIGIVLSSVCTYYEGITTGTFTQNYVQLFDYVTAMSVFVIVKYFVVVVCPGIWEGKFATCICTLGTLTFGIYLMDPFLKLIFYKAYITVAEPALNTLFESFGWCIISLALGAGITYILKRIPILAKIL